MHIEHITLLTGERYRSQRSDVPDETVLQCADWLHRAIHSGQILPLFAPLEKCGAKAQRLAADALLVEVFGPNPDIGERPRLLTFGLALRGGSTPLLWHHLIQAGSAEGVEMPPAPWCATVLHNGAKTVDLQALLWAVQFEVGCVWAWATRNPALRVLPGG